MWPIYETPIGVPPTVWSSTILANTQTQTLGRMIDEQKLTLLFLMLRFYFCCEKFGSIALAGNAVIPGSLFVVGHVFSFSKNKLVVKTNQ
ncbi:hypothetical protein BLOT_007066 [Blomia tropicalis]|nr:hypothetical protein BLOT_007066 [Blomia tropicalis]